MLAYIGGGDALRPAAGQVERPGSLAVLALGLPDQAGEPANKVKVLFDWLEGPAVRPGPQPLLTGLGPHPEEEVDREQGEHRARAPDRHGRRQRPRLAQLGEEDVDPP